MTNTTDKMQTFSAIQLQLERHFVCRREQESDNSCDWGLKMTARAATSEGPQHGHGIPKSLRRKCRGGKRTWPCGGLRRRRIYPSKEDKSNIWILYEICIWLRTLMNYIITISANSCSFIK